MKNEERINEICRKEGRVLLIKEWLGVLFFVAAIIVAIIYYKVISFAVIVPDQFLRMEYCGIAVETIIITLAIFAGLLVSGYFYNRFLSKRLDILWEQKKHCSKILF